MIDLGRIVKMRERKLADHQRAERGATARLASASAVIEAARAEMRDYAEEVRGIESRLLAELIGREIKIDDIRKVEEELARVQAHAQALAAAYDDAKTARAEAEEALARTREGRVKAESKFNKITQVFEVLAEEARLEARLAEDAEMDRIRRPDRRAGQGLMLDIAELPALAPGMSAPSCRRLLRGRAASRSRLGASPR